MSDELKFPNAEERDSIDDRLVSLMRESYTPPDAVAWPDAYWSGLERRIMSRVAGEEEKSWWAELVPWARIGLAAAAAIFTLASVVTNRISAPEEHVAYEAVDEPDLSSASDEPIAAQYVSSDNDAATLRYFLSN
jgi:hypothetical protein